MRVALLVHGLAVARQWPLLGSHEEGQPWASSALPRAQPGSAGHPQPGGRCLAASWSQTRQEERGVPAPRLVWFPELGWAVGAQPSPCLDFGEPGWAELD